MAVLVPNLLIAGAPKSGTSSLHAWLAAHPDCIGSTEKETYFMVDPGTHMHRPDRHVSGGLASYADCFPDDAADYQIRLESTPSYLYSDTAIETVLHWPTDLKVVFVLREPSDQIYSLYRYFQSNWDWVPHDMSFADFLSTVREGHHDFKGNELAKNALAYADYRPWLDRWSNAFGRANMRVHTFDELVADPLALVASLATWLGIDPGFYDRFDFTRENETYQPKSHALQRLNLALRNRLPKGAAYRALRQIYRRLNTRAPEQAGDDDKALKRELRHTFADRNAALGQAYDLDVTGWLTAD